MYAIQWIPVNKIRVNEEYQRPLDKAKVKKLIKEWDWDLFDALKVSPNGRDIFYCWEGQHRLTALRLRGETLAPCHVVKLSVPEQAKKWDDINTNRKPPSTVDHHRAHRVAGLKRALEIDAVLERHGLLVHQAAADNHIRAVTILYKLVHAGGPQHLDDVLTVLGDAWPSERGRLLVPVLGGVGKFLRFYPEVDRRELARTLKRITPQKLVRDGQALTEGLGYDTTTGVARALLAAYNWKRSTRSLPDRFVTGEQ